MDPLYVPAMVTAPPMATTSISPDAAAPCVLKSRAQSAAHMSSRGAPPPAPPTEPVVSIEDAVLALPPAPSGRVASSEGRTQLPAVTAVTSAENATSGQG